MPADPVGVLERYRVEIELEITRGALGEGLCLLAKIAVCRHLLTVDGGKYLQRLPIENVLQVVRGITISRSRQRFIALHCVSELLSALVPAPLNAAHPNGVAPGAADVAAIAARIGQSPFFKIWVGCHFLPFENSREVLGSTVGPEAARVALSLSLRQIVSQNLVTSGFCSQIGSENHEIFRSAISSPRCNTTPSGKLRR